MQDMRDHETGILTGAVSVDEETVVLLEADGMR